jgi:two-component sensor histidine kinase
VRAEEHPHEAARIAALESYEILDTPGEHEFDEVVKLVSDICETPVSLISLVDGKRQWFKAKAGTDISETPIEASICAHGILQKGVFVVPDTLSDPRTADNPLVTGDPHLRFYAGVPLETEEGLPIGMLCVLDSKPRQLTPQQIELIRVMGRQVMNQLEMRRALATARLTRSVLQDALREKDALIAHNELLRQEVDHRVKNSLQQVASLLTLQARRSPNEDAAQRLMEARNRVMTVASIHDHLHRSAHVDRMGSGELLRGLVDTISQNKPPHIAILVATDESELSSEQVLAVGLITNELVSNALKHGYPGDRQGKIEIDFTVIDGQARLMVSDDGKGLAPDFDISAAHGLGMRLLGALASQLKGEVKQQPLPNGARFELTFPRH